MKFIICSDCDAATGEQKRHHKHIWMYSTYCDTCECDFDEWLEQEREKVARELIHDDLNHLVCAMALDEGKFSMQTATEIYTRMRELATSRGYLKLPWERQKQQGERGEAWLTE